MKFFEDEEVSKVKKLPIKKFLDTDFKSFSTYDCLINIPSMIDGFKVSQRKAVYAINKTNTSNTVERYAARVATETAYHHGAANLEGVIVGLAQNFPASNNVNWFTPDGQFGNILDNNASSARYISVEGSPNFRKWFSKDDDLIIEYEFEDGEQIEPRYFIPKVPTLLFNGGSGIGTGYSSTILNYNPKDIVRNVQQVLDGKKQTKLVPWYQGWTGTVSKVEGQTTFRGRFERINSTTICVKELPVGYDQEKYTAILNKLVEKGVIRDYDDDSTEGSGWQITITAPREFFKHSDDVLIDKLGLVARESENIVVWDEAGKIKTFTGPEDLITHFVDARIGFYEKRRLILIDVTKEKIRLMSEKLRFIMFYHENSEKFKNTKKELLVKLLVDNEFSDYDKMLAMPIWNLTKDKIAELSQQVDNENKILMQLESDNAKDMYRRELKEFS